MTAHQGHQGPGRLARLAVGAGCAAMALGAVGLAGNTAGVRPADVGRWALGANLVHDLVAVPLVLLAGTLVRRLVPAPYRGVVQASLVVSAVVTLFAFPFVRGYGRVPNNPSALPRNYGAGLLEVLAAVWVVAGAALVGRIAVSWRRRSTSAPMVAHSVSGWSKRQRSAP